MALSCYQTISRRKKLTGAYSDKSPVASVVQLGESEEAEIVLCSTENRAVLFDAGLIPIKATRSVQGIQVMKLKPKYQIQWAAKQQETDVKNRSRYRAKALPAAGALLKAEDLGEIQMTFSETEEP